MEELDDVQVGEGIEQTHLTQEETAEVQQGVPVGRGVEIEDFEIPFERATQ
jgi:hypothetical protein